uniref:Uncharacterized protein n=1 Tax=Timema genevievae TaxID=629358 RepID=A0A7R9K4F6_TIMGE|nr:unnamed protein product [Timema genevievae]
MMVATRAWLTGDRIADRHPWGWMDARICSDLSSQRGSCRHGISDDGLQQLHGNTGGSTLPSTSMYLLTVVDSSLNWSRGIQEVVRQSWGPSTPQHFNSCCRVSRSDFHFMSCRYCPSPPNMELWIKSRRAEAHSRHLEAIIIPSTRMKSVTRSHSLCSLLDADESRASCLARRLVYLTLRSLSASCSRELLARLLPLSLTVTR